MDKEILLLNIDKNSYNKNGIERIKNNFKLTTNDVVNYCKKKILYDNCNIYK